MIKLKYKKINNVEIAKSIFAVISESVRNDVMHGDADFQPLHEIYDIIINNAQKKSHLQFYTEVYKVLMGIVIASESQVYPQCTVVNVLCVVKKYRQNGFANDMLSKIEKLAKKNKSKKIRMHYSRAGKEFCLNNNYKLKFEISFPENKEEEINKIIDTMPLQFLDAQISQGRRYILFSVDSARSSLIKTIKENIPSATAKYVFEKEL